ncbi:MULTISPECIES: LPXTG cell wall anchor domain-containing protein [unclassified Exiguobacterium]|uniref:LPXTG cell wall anchor domain-containing protein n=1 Tax=unclassified Exiguobacterium TaxID=2644629 RepID=UPI000A5EE5F0|nr:MULTISPECIES: LPXTG cell wall anchor domain-containing protein [unclassified Exiguobacterium]
MSSGSNIKPTPSSGSLSSSSVKPTLPNTSVKASTAKSPLVSKPITQPVKRIVGGTLPNTSENLFLITLMGMLATAAGLFTKLFRRRPQE